MYSPASAPEAAAEVGEPVLVAGIGDHALDGRERRADRRHLGRSLKTGPDHAERGRARTRQVTGGHGARCPRAKLPEPVGLHEGENLGALSREEDDDEAGAVAEARIRLQPGDAEAAVGGRHQVEEARVERHAEAGPILDLAGGEAAEAALDRLDRGLDGYELVDLLFAQIERHRGASGLV